MSNKKLLDLCVLISIWRRFHYKKINRKEHERVAFLNLSRRVLKKKKTVSKLETNSLAKVPKKVKRDQKTLAKSLGRQ